MDTDEFLEHHGIKGMHWGVRRDRSSDGSESSDHAKLKKALIIGGVVVGAAVITAGAVYVAKNGDLSSFSSGKTKAGESFVKEAIKPAESELTKVANIAGGGHHGDWTHRKGGVSDVLTEAKKAGIVDPYGEFSKHGDFRRYGQNAEKVVVTFKNPNGRMDAVKRPIVHHVLLPKQHTEGIDTFEKAQAKAWSLVKDDYNSFADYLEAKGLDATKKEARQLGLMD
jgi:hypothetical protein